MGEHDSELGGDLRAAAKLEPLDEARARHRIQAALFGAEATPQKLGRYTVLDHLGSGAAGVVYAAYDPALDRKVALKLVPAPAQGSAEADARLLREAQSIARVSHANVVTVYDVGILETEHGGNRQRFVSIAMEFVDGTNLARWLERDSHSWQQIVSAFVDAGRGLAAAHREGIVHRDFKPSNVLVGVDGRVRVIDFGLATAVTDQKRRKQAPKRRDRASDGARLFDTLTADGAIVGTPAFMAPEQHAGRAVDARCDQFAFCVALYQAVCGVRPFAGETVAALAESVTRGEIRDPSAQVSVPSGVRRVWERGLRVSVDDRYPSMDALLRDLERTPRFRPRWVIAGAVTPVLASIGYAAAVEGGPRPCEAGEARLEGVWDDARRNTIASAFAATEAPYASPAWRRTRSVVDEYADAWLAMRRDACEATKVRREQSEQLLDRRMLCLERRLAEVEALTDVFVGADSSVVENAVSASLALGELDACSPERAMYERAEPPAHARETIDAIERQLAEGKVLSDAGRYDLGLETVEVAAEAALALGYRPLEARALLVLGALQRAAGHADVAERSLTDAAIVAAETGQDTVAAKAWLQLVLAVGVDQARHETGLAHARAAEAAIARTGGDETMHAQLLGAIGSILRLQGHHEQAHDRLQTAREIHERRLGQSHTRVAQAMTEIGLVLKDLGRLDAAARAYQRALSIARELHGPDHPSVARALGNLGVLAGLQQRFDSAQRYFEQVLAIQEPTVGAQHPDLATTIHNLGLVAESRGDPSRAMVYLQRALAIRERTLGPDHPRVGDSASALGEAFVSVGELADAERYLERDLAIQFAAVGPNHAHAGDALAKLGALYQDQGRQVRARANLERALVIQERELDEPTNVRLAQTRFRLARALRATGGAAERARALAKLARNEYLRANHDELASVDAWLQNQGWSGE